MKGFLVLLMMAFFSLLYNPAHAEVYKRTLPDGSVEFTDVPPEKDAQPMKLPPITTIPAQPKAAKPAASPPVPATLEYESLAISSPVDDMALRANDGNVTVSISSSPALQGDHRYRLLLDGAVQTTTRSTNIQLSNLDRGTHSLQVSIVDKENKLLIQSDSITFHLLRSSIQSR